MTDPLNLKGLRILNTRPRDQSGVLTDLIHNANGRSINCPAVEIQPVSTDWFASLPDLKDAHQAIFTSANAVVFGLQTFAKHGLSWPDHLQIIAIGRGTARALQETGLRVRHCPQTSDSEHLLTLDTLQQVKQQTILLFKGEGGRTLIAETLRQRQARLIELNVYRRTMPNISPQQLSALWCKDAVDIILITSGEALQNLFVLFGDSAHTWLKNKPWLVISERVAQAAAKAGVKKILVGTPETIMETLHAFNKGYLHGR